MRRAVKLTVVMLVIALTSGIGSTMFWHHQTHKHTTLPTPQTAARYSQKDAGRMAVIALESLRATDGQKISAWVKNEDQARFIELLENAQAGMGWHVQPDGEGLDGRRVQVILPRSDVEKLERLADDPQTWARTHSPGQSPATPKFEEMTQITVQLKASDYGTLVLIFGSIICFLTGIAGVMGVVFILDERSAAKRAEGRT